MKNRNIKTGCMEIICGPMFSGKTEELIRRLKRALIAKNKVVIFKPKTDDRYSQKHIVPHNNTKVNCSIITDLNDIIIKSKESQVIGIDEIQFFDNKIVDICKTLANQGKRVIMAGLDKDFLSQSFGSIPELLTQSEYVTKLNAICVKCGKDAHFTQRITNDNAQILVGETDKYEARCRKCFNIKGVN